MTKFGKKIKKTFIGNARDLNDKQTFSRISLVVFFAWVGLGSDPLSSSCYGPEEIYKNLAGHTNLSLMVGFLTVLTIFIISTSYTQIIRLFPHGGGGYLVASRLISPMAGMVSGCALLIDYVLTISISISSGADAIFSFLPASFLHFKIYFALAILLVLILLNLRGVKESVTILTPVFLVFLLSHLFLIFFTLTSHIPQMQEVTVKTGEEFSNTIGSLGIFGTLFLIMKAYSMGAGTYTGIEAVSNGIPNLREPRVKTAIKTMRLLAISLSFAVLGLIISYFIFDVRFEEGKTLNAILIGKMVAKWNPFIGEPFLLITLVSEAALLFVAAQTGFLDGPRVMANMGQDYWFPRRFTLLSDRLVSQNGILLMGMAAFLVIWFSKGLVSYLVVLYSINVFITFTLSQFGMVKHWFLSRKKEKKWLEKLLINGIGLMLTTLILVTVITIKFNEGGWITLIITGGLITVAIIIKQHYYKIGNEIVRIKRIMNSRIPDIIEQLKKKINSRMDEKLNGNATAVILVNGYSGIGLYSVFNLIDTFHQTYNNLIFIQVGIVDSGSFHNSTALENMKDKMELDLNKYCYLAKELGFQSECRLMVGTDVSEEVEKIVPEIISKYPDSIFVGGQLIFDGIYRITKMLHNFTIFSIQRRLYKLGITTIIIPISLSKVLKTNKI